jgi:hypothetical protein
MNQARVQTDLPFFGEPLVFFLDFKKGEQRACARKVRVVARQKPRRRNCCEDPTAVDKPYGYLGACVSDVGVVGVRGDLAGAGARVMEGGTYLEFHSFSWGSFFTQVRPARWQRRVKLRGTVGFR